MGHFFKDQLCILLQREPQWKSWFRVVHWIGMCQKQYLKAGVSSLLFCFLVCCIVLLWFTVIYVVRVICVQNLLYLHIYIYLLSFQLFSHRDSYRVLHRLSLVYLSSCWLYVLHVVVSTVIPNYLIYPFPTSFPLINDNFIFDCWESLVSWVLSINFYKWYHMISVFFPE